MNTIDIKDKSSLKTASKVLFDGGILIFPTDTVYGIGCLVKKEPILKLYKIKNRPLNQPTAILISRKYYPKNIIDDQNIEKEFLGGKVTLLIKKELIDIDCPDILIKDGKVGVRMPKYPWLEQLIDKAGPIVASSVNKKGEPTPEKFIDIDVRLLEKAELVIKIDKNIGNHPSAVYNIETGEYLRK